MVSVSFLIHGFHFAFIIPAIDATEASIMSGGFDYLSKRSRNSAFLPRNFSTSRQQTISKYEYLVQTIGDHTRYFCRRTELSEGGEVQQDASYQRQCPKKAQLRKRYSRRSGVDALWKCYRFWDKVLVSTTKVEKRDTFGFDRR